jgi:hypothetical protein
MEAIVTVVTLLVTAYLLQGAATIAEATTEELLTELDKPSEYLFHTTSEKISYLICQNLSLNITLRIVSSERRSI